jgi:negative regulator of sigma E activity
MSARPDDKFDDELLSAYVDNELDAHERAAVEARLRTDERARQLLEEFRQASEAVRSLPREPAPRDLHGSVLAAIDRAAFEKGAHGQANVDRATTLPMSAAVKQRRMTPRTWALAAFAVAAALMLTVVLPRSVDEHRPMAQATKEETAALQKGNDAAKPGQETTGGVSAPAMAPAPAPASGEAEKPLDSRADAPRAPAAGAAATSAETRGGYGGGRFAEGAPGDMRRQRAELSSAAPPAPGAPSASSPPLEPPAEEQSADEVFEVHVVDEANASKFEQLLAAQRITLRDDQLPADVAAALAEASGEDGAAAEPILVEATREQVDAIVRALGADRDAAAAADAVRLRSRGLAGEPPAGRAWRLPRARALAESEDLQDAAATPPAPAEAKANAENEQAAAERVQREGTVRVLFFLRRPPDAR